MYALTLALLLAASDSPRAFDLETAEFVAMKLTPGFSAKACALTWLETRYPQEIAELAADERARERRLRELTRELTGKVKNFDPRGRFVTENVIHFSRSAAGEPRLPPLFHKDIHTVENINYRYDGCLEGAFLHVFANGEVAYQWPAELIAKAQELIGDMRLLPLRARVEFEVDHTHDGLHFLGVIRRIELYPFAADGELIGAWEDLRPMPELIEASLLRDGYTLPASEIHALTVFGHWLNSRLVDGSPRKGDCTEEPGIKAQRRVICRATERTFNFESAAERVYVGGKLAVLRYTLKQPLTDEQRELLPRAVEATFGARSVATDQPSEWDYVGAHFRFDPTAAVADRPWLIASSVEYREWRAQHAPRYAELDEGQP